MKKTLSLVLALALMISVLIVPASAATEEEKINSFATNVVAMVEKEQLYDAIGILLDVEDVDALQVAYTQGFENMAETQQSRMLSYKLVGDIATAISKDLEADGRNVDDFIADVTTAENLAKALTEDYPLAYAVIVAEEVDILAEGVREADRIFDILNITKVLKVPFMVAEEDLAKAYVDKDQAEAMLLFVNTSLGKDLTDFDSLVGSIQFFLDYYNDSSSDDQTMLFNYLENYGFFKKLAGPVKVDEDGDLVDEDGNIIIEDEALAQFGLGFTDLTILDAFTREAINALNLGGVLNGKGNGIFDPEGEITRAEIATMLARFFGLESDQEVPFDDVSPSAWYAQFVRAVYQAGLLNGTDADTFDPISDITIEEMATIISRAMVSEGLAYPSDERVDEIIATFQDGNLVSDWAESSVAMIVEYEIYLGEPDDQLFFLNPKKKATRAEVAVMLYKLSQIVEGSVID